MERNVTMAEISDGKLYSRDDMVKAGCDDCRGCSACCRGMGNSIVLDPYDVYRLTALRGDTLEHLLEEKKVSGTSWTDRFCQIWRSGAGRMKPVGFSMKQGAAGSMHTGRASAACFHWGAFMKMEVSSIFSRFMSVKRKTGRKSK